MKRGSCSDQRNKETEKSEYPWADSPCGYGSSLILEKECECGGGFYKSV